MESGRNGVLRMVWLASYPSGNAPMAEAIGVGHLLDRLFTVG